MKRMPRTLKCTHIVVACAAHNAGQRGRPAPGGGRYETGAHRACREDRANVGKGVDDRLALQGSRGEAEHAKLVLLRVSGKLVWRVQRRSSSYCWRELTCWSVTCSDSLATSAGIAERIPMGPSDAISAKARS